MASARTCVCGAAIVDDDALAVLRPVSRWTAARKAAVIMALRQQQVTFPQIQQAHGLSIDELVAWNERHRRHGQSGLAVLKLQALP